jgi:hypothetical protein
VLREALRRELDVGLDGDSKLIAAALADPARNNAYFLNLDSHWFAIRRLVTPRGPIWFDLNSIHSAPEIVSDFYMSAVSQRRTRGGGGVVASHNPIPLLPSRWVAARRSSWRR